MTTREALDRALEALREIKATCYIQHGGAIASEALWEIQKGLWIETVNAGARGLCDKCFGAWSHRKDCPEVLAILAGMADAPSLRDLLP